MNSAPCNPTTISETCFNSIRLHRDKHFSSPALSPLYWLASLHSPARQCELKSSRASAPHPPPVRWGEWYLAHLLAITRLPKRICPADSLGADVHESLTSVCPFNQKITSFIRAEFSRNRTLCAKPSVIQVFFFPRKFLLSIGSCWGRYVHFLVGTVV